MSADRRVDRLRNWLRQHEPDGPREARSRAAFLRYLSWLPRPFDETADPVHVTTSAIVVGPAGRVLLHRHKRLGTWLQPGGHVDGEEAPEEAVLREVREESGLVLEHPWVPHPVHVDVHEGGRGHLHLDLRYRLRAPQWARISPAAGESTAIRWFTPEDACASGDASLAAAVRAAGLAAGRDR